MNAVEGAEPVGLGIIRRVRGPKRERSLYEISSSFFAAVVILFAVVGMAFTAFGDDGPGSAGFVICTAFLLLGLGRLYIGLNRPPEE